MKKSIRFVLVLGCGVLAFGQNPGTFSAAGKMTVARDGAGGGGAYTATLLANGKVLIAGGFNQSTLRSAELYDPRTGAFTRTGDMIFPRSYHSATLLPDGRVLIAGGTGRYVSSPLVATAELYDPDTETFSATGDMISGVSNTAILLASGKVLVADDALTAELYDPAAGTFSPTGDQVISGYHQAALLPDGRVLLAACCRNEEIYDPATGTFGFTDKMGGIYQDGFSMASLPNGRVLVQGGFLEELNLASANADLYDPSQGLFNPAGQMTMARYYHSATVLGDGTVLIAGGFGNPISNFRATASTAEIYDPASGTFSRTGDLTTARNGHAATLLLDGMVLITGGDGVGTAEIYYPATPVSAPRLFPVPGDAQGQGAIWHAETGDIASPSHPAAPGEVLSMYTTNLVTDGVMPPQVALGGRLAQVLYFGPTPEYPGYFQVNFRVPVGITPGSSQPVRIIYLGRPSNKVTIAVR
jgi:Kelch motif